MAAACEISNVFSNYFSTMYSPEDPALAPVPPAAATSAAFGADDLMLSLSTPQMPPEGPGGSPREGYHCGEGPSEVRKLGGQAGGMPPPGDSVEVAVPG